MPDSSSSQSDRVQTAIAVAIAVASVVGALLAGSAARLSSQAGDAQQAGLIAAVSVQQVHMVARTSLFQELRALASERAHTVLAEALETDATAADAEGLAEKAHALRTQAGQARASAQAAASFVSPDYRVADGYDPDLFIQDQLLYSEHERDLHPEDDFASSATLRARAEGLVYSLIGLSVAVLILTAAEQGPRRWRPVLFGLGALVLACGVCATLAGDLIRAWTAGA